MSGRRKGRASGGPLDGTQLEAGTVWDGRIERDLTGLYRWNHLTETWDWEPRKNPVSRRSGRPTRSKAAAPPGEV